MAETAYDQAITAVQAATGLSRGALHIYAILFVQLTVAAALRRSLAHLLPWACALAVALAIQWVAVAQASWPRGLASTMAVPTLLLILARFAPELLCPAAGRAGETVADEER